MFVAVALLWKIHMDCHQPLRVTRLGLMVQKKSGFGEQAVHHLESVIVRTPFPLKEQHQWL